MDDEQKTYLYFIQENKIDGFAKRLARNPSDITNIPNLVPTIINKNCVEFMRILINDFGYDVRTNNYAIIACCDRDNPDMVRLLIENGADIRCKQNKEDRLYVCYDYGDESDYPMYRACCHGCYNIVKLLLEYGVSPNAGNGKCLVGACSNNNNKNIVRLLLEYGANQMFDECLEKAIWWCDSEMVGLLVNAGANIQKNNNHLLNALMNFRSDTAKLLLDHGANADAVNIEYGVNVVPEEATFINTLNEYNIDPYAVIRLYMGIRHLQ